MIDAARQRDGIGRQADELLARELHESGWPALETTFVPVDGRAEPFWRNCGFSSATEAKWKWDGEPVFALDLASVTT